MASVQEVREVSGFDQVRLENAGTIILQQGEQERLVIETEAEMLPKIKSEVRNGQLVLGYGHWYDQLFNLGGMKITYYITMRSIHRFSISGAGELQAGRIETDQLHLSVSGAGNITIQDLQTSSLEASYSGTGRASLAGSAQMAEYHISGSANFALENLDCQSARIRISGTATIHLRVSESLNVRISGAGKVRYMGQPAIEHHISGAGSIKRIQPA